MEVEKIGKNIKEDSQLSRCLSDSKFNSEGDESLDENKNDKRKTVKNWTKEEDEILLDVAREFEFKNWKKISERLEGRSAIQCSARYKRIRPGIVKGSWTQEEDEKLKNFIKRFGKNWSLISKYMPTRSGKQIRDRYLNTLDPSILRDKFSSDEDNKIIELFNKHGSSWSLIAKSFSGRTGDMIKNRFYSSLKKVINNGYSKNNELKNDASFNVIRKKSGINDSNIFYYDTINIKDDNFSQIPNEDESQISQNYSNKQNELKENTKQDNNEKLHKIFKQKKMIANNFSNNEICQNLLKKDKRLIQNNKRNKDKNEDSIDSELIQNNENKDKNIKNYKMKIHDDGKQVNLYINNKRKKPDLITNDHSSQNRKNHKGYNRTNEKNYNFGENSNSKSDFDIDISSLDSYIKKTEENLTKKYFNGDIKLTNTQSNKNNNFLMNLNNLQQDPGENKNNISNNIPDEKSNLKNTATLDFQPQSLKNFTSSELSSNYLNKIETISSENLNLNSFLNLVNFIQNVDQSQGFNSNKANLNSELNSQTFNVSINNLLQNNSNSNFIDLQMNFLINCLLESNFSRITYCRDELENQLNMLKKLLDFTQIKLENLRKFNENIQENCANSNTNPFNFLNLKDSFELTYALSKHILENKEKLNHSEK